MSVNIYESTGLKKIDGGASSEASGIHYDNADSGMTATNVQDAIDELNGDLDNAIKNITRSGTTFTATRTNGSTFTFTQQDNDTTTGTTYNAGACPNNTTFGTNGSINKAYSALNSAISTEATTRSNTDTSLQNQINTIGHAEGNTVRLAYANGTITYVREGRMGFIKLEGYGDNTANTWYTCARLPWTLTTPSVYEGVSRSNNLVQVTAQTDGQVRLAYSASGASYPFSITIPIFI